MRMDEVRVGTRHRGVLIRLRAEGGGVSVEPRRTVSFKRDDLYPLLRLFGPTMVSPDSFALQSSKSSFCTWGRGDCREY
jgi:hypothetical protein